MSDWKKNSNQIKFCKIKNYFYNFTAKIVLFYSWNEHIKLKFIDDESHKSPLSLFMKEKHY